MAKARDINIDSDILIYKAAMLAETYTDWNDGTWTLEADMADAIDGFARQVEDIKEALDFVEGVDTIHHYLSDHDRSRLYRKELLPTYKANRNSTRRPMLLVPLWEYVNTELDGRFIPGLEGDDMLGASQTEDSICVSIDKDMLTIPGLHLNMGKPELGVFRQSEYDADLFFYQQVLAGDATDNYSGCPGIGMKTAAKILEDEPHIVVETRDYFVTGKRAGEEKITWSKQTGYYSVWETILSYYEKAGLTPEDALVQARMARILRPHELDKDNKAILWTP